MGCLIKTQTQPMIIFYFIAYGFELEGMQEFIYL